MALKQEISSTSAYSQGYHACTEVTGITFSQRDIEPTHQSLHPPLTTSFTDASYEGLDGFSVTFNFK